MSIYAGPFFEIKVPIGDFGDEDKWCQVFGMAVPSHIGRKDEGYDEDPYADFLPPVCTDYEHKMNRPRAVVVVDENKSEKDGQEYRDALFTLPGEEFEMMTFIEVMSRIKKAVNERYSDG